MSWIDKLFKNVKPASLKWLGLGAIAGAGISVAATFLNFDLVQWLGTIVGIGTGGFLIAESSVKGFEAPKGFKGILHLGSFIVGAGVLLVTLLPIIGVSVPMAITTAATWSAPFIVAELFV